MFAMSNAGAEQPQKFEHSYRAFFLAFAKVAVTFLFGGALLAFLFDAALVSLALLLDLLGHPNNMSRKFVSFMFGSPLGAWMVAVTYLVLLIPQFISALFASASFLVIGRVPLWWMMVTAPLVVHRAGLSFFSAEFWNDASMSARSPGFWTVLAIQIGVVTICWWWIRNLRQPALWSPNFRIRSDTLG